ncbi:hypothetical protein [Devosia sp. XK-2]|uniref:hypothetical protein n=1 Tax=Devosia sp. XK-2 TaxID=3126689 RepID=UPI0030CC2959
MLPSFQHFDFAVKITPSAEKFKKSPPAALDSFSGLWFLIFQSALNLNGKIGSAGAFVGEENWPGALAQGQFGMTSP